ncbi:MAG: FtsX-like permease family protein [Caldilineaceae bacterium SB0668_bin_21]|nr:FtsX-like permease family protein [Caldilineaceae bacterium SB0668_bin_21]MYC21067.1 FtsX-like permease family protein [Caldilineaceae bacterium SB0662_bin_25]
MMELALRRNLSKWQPMSFVVVGLVVTVALIAAIPLFTNAALDRFLRSELAAQDAELPLSSLLLVHRVPLLSSTPLEQYRRADDFMRQRATELPGLPLTRLTRYGSTRVLKFLASADKELPEDLRQYQSAGLAFLTGIEQHVEIVLGEPLGQAEPGEAGDVIPAWVSERFYYDHEVQVGDRVLFGLDDSDIVAPVEVLVKGVWRPADADRGFWFEEPEAFAFYFIVSEADFMGRVAPTLGEQVRKYAWFLLFDGEEIKVEKVAPMLAAITRIQARTSGILSHVDLTAPAYELLQKYADRAAALRTFLLLLSLPVLLALLLYTLISSDIMVASEESEIVTLKSRGASSLQIVALYLLEMLAIGALCLTAGLLAAGGVTQGMGQVYRFLTFAARPLMDLSYSAQVALYAGTATVLGIGATLLSAAGAARRTVVTHQRKTAREEFLNRARRSAWLPFELLFLAGVIYAYWRLRQQEHALQITQDTFVDPLLLLAPTVFVAAVALVSLRGLPAVTGLLGRAASRFISVPLWLAITQISRRSGSNRALLFLLIFTIALGLFSATFAGTLDTHYTDVVRYAVGSDLAIRVQWEQVGGSSEQRWRYPPFAVVESIPGVEAATRVLRQPVFVDGLEGNVNATVLGIDRAEFSRAGWWRDDFSQESLGALTNRLALNSMGVLVSRSFIEATGLRVGDNLSVFVEGISRPINFTIAGVLSYFPTLYPEDGHFFVGNLEHIYRTIGNRPYDIWMRLASSADPAAILETLRARGFIITDATDSRWETAVWRTDPQRTALFGILSLGFVVATVISGLAFLLHSMFALRQRILQFGLLRAIGLSTAQITAVVVFEKLFLVLLAAVGGSLIGALTSALFVPLLQIGTSVHGSTPPFVVSPAWGQAVKIYLAFAVMVIVTLAIVIGQLRQLRIYEAIKLGGLE